MIATYVQEGKRIDIRPTADVSAGDIVVTGALIGVASLDIKADELGAISTEGVYEVAKASAVAFTVGAVAYWDEDTKTVVATTSKPRLGIVVAAAEADAPSVRVKLG